ncbi:MAG: GGDEF domain-containing protein [Coriobacteriia bacterium]|nr:GGDEF domain-containing protein [Coriobacteriia bacterium]
MSKAIRIAAAAALFVVLAVMLVWGFASARNAFDIGSVPAAQTFDQGWTTSDGSSVAEFPFEGSSPCSITNTLPTLMPDDNLILWYQEHLDRIEINGQVVFTSNKNMLLNRETTLGTTLVFVPLSAYEAGSQVTLYYHEAAYTGHVFIGSPPEYAAYLLETHPIGISLSVVLFLTGIILLLLVALFLAFQPKRDTLRDAALVAEIGCFFVCLSTWMIADTEILDPLFNIAAYNSLLSYLALFLAPLPFVSLMGNLLGESRRVTRILQAAYTINFLAQCVLFVAGVFDLSQMLVITHLLYAVGAITIVVIGVKHALSHRTRSGAVVAVVGLAVFSVLMTGGILAYRKMIDIDYAFFVNLGIMALTISLMYYAVGTLIRGVEQRARNAQLEHLAYHDALTGLGNRQAYENELDRWRQGAHESNLSVVALDVNMLKTTNDTLGHSAGDEIIKAAADCMGAAFENALIPYRHGGDEFSAVGVVSKEELDALIARLRALVENWKGTYCPSLSVSLGYARWEDFPQASVEELCKEADRLMYQDKSAFYQRIGRDRRAAR